MTREEFEDGYAGRSGVTVEWLRVNGREAAPCDCGECGCEGWQMAFAESLERQEREGMRMLPRDRAALAYIRAHRACTPAK